jgi:hypothetical protein
VVVTKLDPTGQNIVYSTYLPAGGFSTASAIAVDGSGNAYLTGITGGYDFPVTSQNLGTCTSFCNAGFITKLSATGQIVYSTLLASGQILPKAVAVNASGNAFVSGLAADASLQTVNAFQASYNGGLCTSCNSAFFVELNTAGTGYVFASYLGAQNNATGIALDGSGNIYVAGTFNSPYQPSIPLFNQFQSGLGGFFLNKFSSNGKLLLFGSFLGGASGYAPDALTGIGVGTDGAVYLAGNTASSSFPYTVNAYRLPLGPGNGFTQMFAMALDPSLKTLKYSTYLGAGYMNAMAVDPSGHLYAAGTVSADSIQAKNAVVSDLASGAELLELDATGNPVQITGLGGHSVSEVPSALALDQSGSVYVAGSFGSAGGAFTTGCFDPILVGAAAYQTQAAAVNSCQSGNDLFFAKIAPDANPQISLGYELPFLPLHNVGTADLHISNISLSGGIAKTYGNCGATVPAGSSCVLTLTDANGNLAQGTVTITSDATPSVQTFTPYANPSAIGSPVQDFLWSDVSKLFFPPQLVGTTSSPRPFQLWNVGVTSLNLESIAANGSLLQTHNCTTPLEPGAFCTVQVVWKPTPNSSYGNSVSVSYDNGPAFAYTVPSAFISSSTPLLVSQSDPIPFGTQVVGGSSLYRTVTVTNVSNAQVASPAVSLTGDHAFSISGNTCTGNLASQQSCVIAVLFTPVTNADNSATLSISGGASASIYLSGTGLISSAITVAPYELQWYQVVLGTSYSQSVSLLNTSASTIPVSSISFSSSDFSETDNCGGSLASGASCTVQVKYQPQQAGTENASMTINFGGQATTQVVSLEGGAVLPVTITPAAIDFGTNNSVGVAIAPQSFLIENQTSSSQAYVLSVTGPFTLANTCSNPLQGNYACSATVTFQPPSAGTFSGAITVSVPGIAPTGTIALSGSASGLTGSGLQFVPVTPCRVADTRNAAGPFGGPELAAGASRAFHIPQSACGIPSAAVAYSLNVTVVPDHSLGYLTLWPSGQAQPYVSTLNSDGRVKANAAITPAGTDGAVSVFVTDATQLILDIDGYFVPTGTASALDFYPLAPCRVADTRNAAGPLGGPYLKGKTSRSFALQASACGLPANAQAYSLNVTAVPHKILNYLTTWPTGQSQPNTSTLNAATGAVVANAAIVPAGENQAVSVFVSNDADVILDVNGYFAAPATGGLSLYTTTPCRAIDTRGEEILSTQGTLAIDVQGGTCAPPAAAQAYVLNATVVPSGPLNFLTLWSGAGSQPNVSTLNAADGAVTSNMAIVPTTNGNVEAFADGTTNLILDLSSYFAP